jgi:hypothetical protein
MYLAPARGAYRDRHGRWARDAVDASGARRRTASMRTVKSCGPDAPTLASSLRKVFRKRRWQESPVTGESTKEPVKTTARGMPVDCGVPVVTTLVCFLPFAREATGATAHPAFPAPSVIEGDLREQLGLSTPRDRGGVFVVQPWRGGRIYAGCVHLPTPAAPPKRARADKSRTEAPLSHCAVPPRG